jgi:hypothetical protein
MTPLEFCKIGRRIYQSDFWKAYLARDLGIDVSTVRRIAKRAEIPGPYEVAMKAMLNATIAKEKADKEARKLLPRKLKRRKTPRKTRHDRTRIQTARPDRARHPQPGPDRLDETADEERKADGVLATE